jgi:hypothetical protein
MRAFPGGRRAASHPVSKLRRRCLRLRALSKRPSPTAALRPSQSAAADATSAPACPWTELRGNLAYCSILAAAGLQCATPWPALIRNSSLRNGHVCLFYPPRAHSATPHENTAQLAAQPTSLPERPLRADACAGRRGLRASSSASLPLTPASASHRSEPGDQGLSPSFRIHASGPGALSPSWPLLCSEPATLDGCWREACGGRVLRANPRLHPLTSRVPLS